ncbi:MAG: ATP-binding protein [Pseudomonadota bacterium]
MFCGKIASGKSILALQLSRTNGGVLLSEDKWLEALYFDQMSSGADYVRCSLKLRSAIGPHVVTLLDAGLSVILDFPANTVEQRSWVFEIIEKTGALHQMHVLNVSDDVCLSRLRNRNARDDHAFVVTEKQFRQFSKHFAPPSPDEGFNVVTHQATD